MRIRGLGGNWKEIPHRCCKCVNSAEKNLDATAYMASCMVAVEVENKVGVNFLTIDGYFKVIGVPCTAASPSLHC